MSKFYQRHQDTVYAAILLLTILVVVGGFTYLFVTLPLEIR